jgi:hypothetical protein
VQKSNSTSSNFFHSIKFLNTGLPSGIDTDPARQFLLASWHHVRRHELCYLFLRILYHLGPCTLRERVDGRTELRRRKWRCPKPADRGNRPAPVSARSIMRVLKRRVRAYGLVHLLLTRAHAILSRSAAVLHTCMPICSTGYHHTAA